MQWCLLIRVLQKIHYKSSIVTRGNLNKFQKYCTATVLCYMINQEIRENKINRSKCVAEKNPAKCQSLTAFLQKFQLISVTDTSESIL